MLFVDNISSVRLFVNRVENSLKNALQGVVYVLSHPFCKAFCNRVEKRVGNYLTGVLFIY